ncbi:MAG: outer membrane beta-barrel protein [Saprospiraceae bacterium]
MENNFDKIFKDKLEHRQFEMKPEYWEGAEALIDADKKSGDWRRFLIWFGVALMAGLGVFFIWKNDNSNPIVENDKTENTALGNVSSPTIENDKSEFEISDKNVSEAENKLTELNDTNIAENVSTPALGENKKSEKNIAEVKSTKPLNQNTDLFSKTIPSNPSVNNLENNNNSNEIENNNNASSSSNSNTPTFTSDEGIQSNQPIGNINSNTGAKENEEKLIPIIDKEISSIRTEDVIKKEETRVQPIASSSTVMLPFLELLLANNKKIEKLDLEAVCPFTPSRDKFTYGLFGGAVGYPLIENSSETPFIGFKGGLLMERNFEIGKAKLAVGAELAYHYRSGNFVATKQNEVTSYSFGRSIAQAKLTPENLHYLELPIYLKYQKNRMTLETGASFNYLLGVGGKIIEADRTENSGWVPSLGFKKNHVNVLLGFHYRISDNLHFGVRANYTPGGILDKGVILPDGLTVALQESRPFYVTFRVTQYLKLKR